MSDTDLERGLIVHRQQYEGVSVGAGTKTEWIEHRLLMAAGII
jgi:hypothetical protein